MTRPRNQQARVQKAANDDLALRPVRPAIDWGCVDRIAAYAADRRAEIGEAEWNRLQQEWNA